ncbi:hypothetical protein [Amycolatopsis aidingensis]|uniref:hypothetical protein n=1 Tax=Amycolatopsis aidingensis TaxID=2842453 RepID=UPI001C0DDE74|nr:hypothetical protein [Amycolatopsis aidingensis]
MSSDSTRPAGRSPLASLQDQFSRPAAVARFDGALRDWALQERALAGTSSRARLRAVLGTRDYDRHDAVLFALLQRAAAEGRDGVVAAELVLDAMAPAVPGIVGRVLRAMRVVATSQGPRRGVTGAGVSATEDAHDVQVMVLGHLWEVVRCYPLRRRRHVAANLVREAQRAALRSFGVYYQQPTVDVVSLDDLPAGGALVDRVVERDASEELLELLAWAVESEWMDERATALLTARYFGDQIGRDGVATDRQVAAEIGVSQPTVTRHRQAAERQLAAAAREFANARLDRAG